MEVLYALVRTLDIDSREIFYPEIGRDSPALDQLRLMIECCGEHEAEKLPASGSSSGGREPLAVCG